MRGRNVRGGISRGRVGTLARCMGSLWRGGAPLRGVGCYSGVGCDVCAARVTSFKAVTSALLTRLPRDRRVFELVFFKAPTGGGRCMAHHGVLDSGVRRHCPRGLPMLDCMSRPTLSNKLAVRMRDCRTSRGSRVVCRPGRNFPCVALRGTSNHFLFTKNFRDSILGFGARRRSIRIFQLTDRILRGRGFPVRGVVHR